MSLAFVLDHTSLVFFAGEEEQVNALGESFVHGVGKDVTSLNGRVTRLYVHLGGVFVVLAFLVKELFAEVLAYCENSMPLLGQIADIMATSCDARGRIILGYGWVVCGYIYPELLQGCGFFYCFNG